MKRSIIAWLVPSLLVAGLLAPTPVPMAQNPAPDQPAPAAPGSGMPHEFYRYEGLQHYCSTRADNATTLQMFRAPLFCLRKTLASE